MEFKDRVDKVIAEDLKELTIKSAGAAFIGSEATDNSGFKIGKIRCIGDFSPSRLVINYKNTSALLCTKYGNFDFNELDFENYEEVELNGIVFKKVKEV